MLAPLEIDAGQRNGPGKQPAHLRQQRERAQRPRVTAGARAHEDQSIHAFLGRLHGVAHIDHVVQHDAAIGMRGLHHFGRSAQAGDRDRHLVLHAHGHVVLEPVVGGMHDLVDGKRRHAPLGMRLLVGVELRLDLDDPLLQQLLRPRIERRERTDDTGLALRNHQVRHRHDEQRRADGRQRQAILQDGRYRHAWRAPEDMGCRRSHQVEIRQAHWRQSPGIHRTRV